MCVLSKILSDGVLLSVEFDPTLFLSPVRTAKSVLSQGIVAPSRHDGNGLGFQLQFVGSCGFMWLRATAVVLQLWDHVVLQRCGIAAVVLQLWDCSCGIAAVGLQLWTVVLKLWDCSCADCGIAAVGLQLCGLWYCSCVDCGIAASPRTVVLQLWDHVAPSRHAHDGIT